MARNKHDRKQLVRKAGVRHVRKSGGRTAAEGWPSGETFEGIVGCSDAVPEIVDQVRTLARTDSTVLIEDETGAINIALDRSSVSVFCFTPAALFVGVAVAWGVKFKNLARCVRRRRCECECDKRYRASCQSLRKTMIPSLIKHTSPSGSHSNGLPRQYLSC